MDVETPKTKHTLIRNLLRRYGVLKVTMGVTLIVTLCSLILTTVLDFVIELGVSIYATVLAIAIPIILVPIFEYRSFRLLDELDKAEQRLRILATTDDLTSAYNRRYFIELANAEIARVERYGGRLSLAILDLDNLKAVNDQYGHLVGDQALILVSKICRTNIRKTDIFARYGGDEFVMLFPETDEGQARECLQRIIYHLAEVEISYEAPVHPRISVGLFAFNTTTNTTTLDDLLNKADVALYRAKQTGGNKVI
jgi:diguanylate cyclase (GGDEF)-like protein